MAKCLTVTSVAATLMLLGATTIPSASAEDIGGKISGAFTDAYKGLKDGMLGAYEDGTEGAKDLYGDAKAELSGQPRDPYKTTAAAPVGVRDDLVYRVQTELNAAGYAAGAPDGIYGPQTASAVRAYQTNNGLVADGVVTMSLYDHMRANPNRPAGATPPAGRTSAYTAPAPAPVQSQPVPPAASPAPATTGTAVPAGTGSAATAPALPALPGQQTGDAAPAIGTTAGSTTGQTCQPYESRMMVDGKEQVTAGKACLQPDGTWKRIN